MVTHGEVSENARGRELPSSAKTVLETKIQSDPLTMRRDGYEITYNTYARDGEKGFRTAMVPSEINPKVVKNYPLQSLDRDSVKCGEGICKPYSGPVVKTQDVAMTNLHTFRIKTALCVSSPPRFALY